MPRPSRLALSLFLVVLSAAATPARTGAGAPSGAATADGTATAAYDAADADSLEAITVTATRLPQPIGDVAATVSVIDADAIERRNVRDIEDLVRYEPGVSVPNGLTRFGLAGFTIRGLGGNRVLIEVDGIRQSDAFAIGNFASAGRNAVDVDTLKQAEILRGPASSLYGSSALGGVVSFVTKDPVDYLADGDDAYLRLRGGFDRDDDGSVLGFTSAARFDPRWSALASYNHRDFRELDNQGTVASADSTRTLPNPQQGQSDSLLGKLVFEPTDGHRVTLAAERYDADVATEVLSALGETRLGTTRVQVESLEGDDATARSRLSVDWDFDRLGPFDGGHLLLSTQDSRSEQLTRERRTSIAPNGARTPAERDRRFRFEQEVLGVELVLRSDFDTGALAHRLVYGVERIDTDTAQLRDGTQRNLLTGAVSPNLPPDLFPVRDFPLSRTRETALFVEDEIRVGDGRLTLVPGLRCDRYALDPELDAIFLADNPGIAPVPIDDDRVSPRLAASWRLDQRFSLHASYATGFRAPPYNDANIGFTNLAFGYTAIPNPELESETSRGLELGLRARGEAGYAALTAYYNEYDRFIESLASLGVDPTTRLLVFQSRNVDEVSIKGLEFRGALMLGALSGALEGVSLETALAWSRGDDQRRDLALDSIDPARAVLGLAWEPVAWPLRVELVASAARRKTRVAETGPAPLFRPPGYAVFDLHARWRMHPALRLDLSLFNLGDRRYWVWGNVRGRAADDPALDRFTQPGRGVAATLVAEF